MLTQEKLKSKLVYNPETGLFLSLKNGRVLGTKTDRGYIKIMVLGKLYRAHRLAWLYMHGEIPPQLDHINHNRSDNRISNLRIATNLDNARNRTLHINSPYGLHGVSKIKDKNIFVARIGNKTVGKRKDFFEACCLRKSAERRLNYHINHGTV